MLHMLHEKKNSQIFIVLVVCVSFSYICNSLHSCAKKVGGETGKVAANVANGKARKQPLLFLPVQLCACCVVCNY